MATPPPLSPAQCQQFHEQGYVIVPDVFDPADLEPVRQELHREMWPEAPAGKDFKNSLNRLGRVDRVSLRRLS